MCKDSAFKVQTWRGTPRNLNVPIAATLVSKRFAPARFPERLPGESPGELCERLRNEINHGKEYLLQVQAELRENRQLLEQWAQYEQTCSLQPLDHLVECVRVKQSVEEFLTGWLKRHQQRLAKLEPKSERRQPRR